MNKKKSLLRFETMKHNPKEKGKERCFDLGNGSQVTYIPRFLPSEESWKWLDYLQDQIPWTRPSIRVFGRSCIQPRDTCYIASEGLPELKYSGYQPHAYSWDEFPPLKVILAAVHEALPGSSFNSLLLNRYKSGSDYVAWHSDNEKFYGPTPEIASVSFGCEREFLLRKKPSRLPQALPKQWPCIPSRQLHQIRAARDRPVEDREYRKFPHRGKKSISLINHISLILYNKIIKIHLNSDCWIIKPQTMFKSIVENFSARMWPASSCVSGLLYICDF